MENVTAAQVKDALEQCDQQAFRTAICHEDDEQF